MPKFRILLLLAAAAAVSACTHQTPAPVAPAPAATAAAAPDPDSAQMPDGPGKALTVSTCSGCHSLARVVAEHQTRAQWQATLSAMEDNGLSVTPEGAEDHPRLPQQELPRVGPLTGAVGA